MKVMKYRIFLGSKLQTGLYTNFEEEKKFLDSHMIGYEQNVRHFLRLLHQTPDRYMDGRTFGHTHNYYLCGGKLSSNIQ